MASWDLPFDVALDDVDLARGCFRVLRRTCGRQFVGFGYREIKRGRARVDYLLEFNGRPAALGLASADFSLEMHAVSTLQQQARRRRLPLRLLHWVTFSGSDEPWATRPTTPRVSDGRREQVLKHLEEYALAWGAWRRDEMPPADYLEAQHSLVTNLALDLAEGVDTRTKYPELVKALRVPAHMEPRALELGTNRNRVKHRGFRHEAERYAIEYEQFVFSLAYHVTGIEAMPRSAYMVRWEADPSAAFKLPPMFDRYGNAKRYTRY